MVLGVLVQGALAPESTDETSEATPPEPPPPLPPHRGRMQLSDTVSYWSEVGERLRRNLVLVGRDGTPGVVVAPGTVVAALRAADELQAEQLEGAIGERRAAKERVREASNIEGKTAESLDEREPAETTSQAPSQSFSPAGIDPEQGIALFKVSKISAGVARRPDPEALQAGAHIAAVSLTADHDLRITPGVLVSVEEGSSYPRQDTTIGEDFDVAIPFPPGTRTAAIVDLDGGLLGVAVESPSGVRVLSAHTVEQIINGLSERRPCMSIETRNLSDEIRRVLGVRNGVLVERVRREAFLPEPSVVSGDILLRWAGRELTETVDWEQLYGDQEPGSLVRYVLQRGKRRLSGATRIPGPDCRPVARSLETFAALGLVLRWDSAGDERPPEGWTVMGVAQDTPAAKAGLVRGDRIVAAQGQVLTLRDRRRALEPFERRDATLVMTVWRGNTVQLIAVAPQTEPAGEPAEPGKQPS